MMVERYRDHLIFVKANQDRETALWKAGTHVQFNQGPRAFHDVWLPRPPIGLKTKRKAEKQMMKEAKKWVDDRLRAANQERAGTGSLRSSLVAREQNLTADDPQ
jgi:hypothetical protein